MNGRVKPDEFWRLSHYDFMLYCYSISNDVQSDRNKLVTIETYIRNLYTLIYNVNRGKGAVKSAKSLWHIPLVDGDKNVIKEDFIERVRKYEQKLIKEGRIKWQQN